MMICDFIKNTAISLFVLIVNGLINISFRILELTFAVLIICQFGCDIGLLLLAGLLAWIRSIIVGNVRVPQEIKEHFSERLKVYEQRQKQVIEKGASQTRKIEFLEKQTKQ